MTQLPHAEVALVDEEVRRHRQRRGQWRLKECGSNEKPAFLRQPGRANGS